MDSRDTELRAQSLDDQLDDAQITAEEYLAGLHILIGEVLASKDEGNIVALAVYLTPKWDGEKLKEFLRDACNATGRSIRPAANR